SPFTLASTDAMANPLPIELLYFDARPNGKVVNLHWATATEQNNDFFSIERSRDGLKFEEIMRTPGAGNSTERKDYSEVDTRPLSGLSYYRLRQTDFNGETTVSQVVAVRIDGEGNDIRVFPNPADDFFFVETAADPSSLRVRLLNHVGQTVPLAPQVQASRLMFQTSNLAAGVYYIEIQQNNGVQSRKVIVR
ncbi:MAG TPA: T9SS type A sorting domain-containing protein, partial [Saprospiraceae bacterium]|nr:T9SS type A sorting domain-containing protein [Saprospiraceae bacterium]